MKYTKGNSNENYCEICRDGVIMGDVNTEDADRFIDLLNRLTYENNQLRKGISQMQDTLENHIKKEQLPFLKIINDYFIQYEDGELFSMHKPSDIRCLMNVLNRDHGYSELQCEYNDEKMEL